jgi:hypothetical protein
MRWFCLALLLFMAPALGFGGEIWRWVDEQGVVHYSDRPRPGAERVELGPAQSYEAPEVVPRPSRPEREPAEAPAAPRYSRLSIVSPEEGEMLWNIGGELTLQLAVEPAQQDGHELRVYLDGERVADVPQGETQFTISNVFRGERRIRAAIVDDQGRELASTGTTLFYVQQASLLNPNRPAPPGGGG